MSDEAQTGVPGERTGSTATEEARDDRRVLRLLVAIAAIVLGAVLATRPYTSVSALVALTGATAVLTGLLQFLSSTGRSARLDVVLGAAWVVVGVVILLWPDLSVRALAVVVGVGMVIGGLTRIVGGVRGTRDERIASVLLGAASVILGVLALAWPEITVLVVGVVFGVRTVLFGLSQVIVLVAGERWGTPDSPGRIRRSIHVVAAAAALLVSIALGSASAALRSGEPTVDDFYDSPADLPGEPGRLLRSESFSRGIPEDARAWRILYTTTRDDGVPAVASGLVIVPAEAPSSPMPVVAWAHGTTGVDRTCAPSVLADPLGSGAFYALDQVLAEGWALVATDYVGLGTEGPHPYLIGQGQGRSVLDAVRAARQLGEVDLAADTVVWGHSQGGNAALWTGQLAPEYAPDAGVKAVAALAPASDPAGLAANLYEIPGGSIFASYVVEAYAAVYDDVDLDDYVRPAARPQFDALAGRCLGEPAVLASVLESIATGMDIFSQDIGDGPLGDRLAENSPGGPFAMPLLIAQGAADPLVVPAVQAEYAERLCSAGVTVEYRTYEGRDHVGVVAADSPLLPDLVGWTRQRLDGDPFADTC